MELITRLQNISKKIPPDDVRLLCQAQEVQEAILGISAGIGNLASVFAQVTLLENEVKAANNRNTTQAA
jgi:hypothetical protein